MSVVAIDGPAGAGKSTVARLVAQELGLPYLDTGAMYRCVALAVIESGISHSDAEAIAQIAQSVKISVELGVATLNGIDVSSQIRGSQVSGLVSLIAAMSPVRHAMRTQQQNWVDGHFGGVVEGRDIGTVVLPLADVKIFLTASAQQRAFRRVSELGGDINEVALQIEQRDEIDSTRIDSPLVPAQEAIVVDSTSMTAQEVVDSIVAIVRNKTSAGNV